MSGEWGPLTGPRCGSQGVPDGPLPAGLFGAGEGRRRRCHLSPRRGGGRPGWGPAVLRLLRTRPPPPILLAGVTSRLGKLPPQGAGLWVLPAEVHGPRPCGGLPPRLHGAAGVGGVQVGLHLNRCFQLGFVGVSQH